MVSSSGSIRSSQPLGFVQPWFYIFGPVGVLVVRGQSQIRFLMGSEGFLGIRWHWWSRSVLIG